MTNRGISRSRFAQAAGATALSLSALPGSRVLAQPAPTLTTVNVGVFPSPDMAALLYARSQHAFEKAGIDLQMQNVQNGVAALAAATGGSLEFGYGNTYSLVLAFQRGIPVKIVAPGAMYNSKAPTVKLLVAGDSAIKAPKDLVGKTIGVPTVNDLTGLSLIAWLASNGVDQANVHFYESPPNLMIPALQSHRIDAGLLYDPFLTAGIADGLHPIGNTFDAIGSRFMAAAWFSVAPWVTEHRPVARTFALVLGHAAEYANSHYLDLVPMLAEFSKMPAAVLGKLTRRKLRNRPLPAFCNR